MDRRWIPFALWSLLSAAAQLPFGRLWRWLLRWDRAALVPSYWFFAPGPIDHDLWLEARADGPWSPVPAPSAALAFAPSLRVAQQVRDACAALLRAPEADRERIAAALLSLARAQHRGAPVDLRVLASRGDEAPRVLYERDRSA